MKNLKVFFCQVLLFGFTLSSPIENKIKDNKSISPVTASTPLKAVSTPKNINKEEVQSINNSQTEKPATKKRDIPEDFSDKSEYFNDDSDEGKPVDDYDNIQVLRTYLDNTRNLEPSRFRASDYGYYGEARRKRTAVIDGIFNKPDGYYEPEIQLTPEDIMALNAYRQQQRLYNSFPYGRWSDVNNPIDIVEPEIENDDVYTDRQENFFDRLYDQRYQNWANLPRTEKFLANRRRRSFLGNPKLRVPLYRRAIL